VRPITAGAIDARRLRCRAVADIMPKVSRDLRTEAVRHAERLRPIDLVVLDVDGVLTDGRVTWSSGHWTRSFHVHDGFGIKMLLRLGLEVAVISADDNPAMDARIDMLGIRHAYTGAEDKRAAWLDLLATTGRTDRRALYVADELFDLPLLRRAGFSATVPNAAWQVRECVDYITERPGGGGAVREVIDLLCLARGLEPHIPDFADPD